MEDLKSTQERGILRITNEADLRRDIDFAVRELITKSQLYYDRENG